MKANIILETPEELLALAKALLGSTEATTKLAEVVETIAEEKTEEKKEKANARKRRKSEPAEEKRQTNESGADGQDGTGETVTEEKVSTEETNAEEEGTSEGTESNVDKGTPEGTTEAPVEIDDVEIRKRVLAIGHAFGKDAARELLTKHGAKSASDMPEDARIAFVAEADAMLEMA